ncbi:putative C-terminal processing peptidase, chloroplastic-like isoform X1 [Capsicum annuum]|nr:putative C-terminal processing peptidase, chloroplastic-like isoform X1 [Capsicum annuum]
MALRFSHVLQHVLHSSSFILHELSDLSSLTDLHLSNLNILGGLPEELGSLLFLDELNLSGSNISWLPKSIKQLLQLQRLDVQFCQNLNELPGEQLPPNLTDLYLDYHLFLKSIRDLVTKCLNLNVLSISWCRHEKSEYGTVSMSQVNVLKSLHQLIRTCIQCDFHQRDFFLTSFPEVRSPELFNYQVSIDLNPSWYNDKFMGFTICYGCNTTLEDLKERFDKVNRLRIFQLHREITTISQGTDSLATYFTRLRELWAEYDDLVPIPGYNCTKSRDYVDHLQRHRLLQFLSGLSDLGGHVKDDCYWLKGRPAEGQMKINAEEHKKKNCVANSSEQKPYNSYNAHYEKRPHNPHFDRRNQFTVNNVMNEEQKSYANVDAHRNSGWVDNGANAFTDAQYKQLEQLCGRSGPSLSDDQYRQIKELLNGKKDQATQHGC